MISGARAGPSKGVPSRYRPTAQARTMAREAVLFELKWQDLERIVEELVEVLCDEFRELPSTRSRCWKSLSSSRTRPRVAEGGESIDSLCSAAASIVSISTAIPQGSLTRIRVYDYKTSREPPTATADMLRSEAFGTTAFQLPVYLMAGRERSEANSRQASRSTRVT